MSGLSGLRQLLNTATPRPWTVSDEGHEDDGDFAIVGEHGRGWCDYIAENVNQGYGADARLIVALANCADELLAVAEAAENLAADIGHLHDCQYRTAAKGWKPGEPPVIECVCGLDAFEAALAALGGRLA